MLLLLLTVIFMILKHFGVIGWPNWVVFLPSYIVAGFATWLYVKAEVAYFINVRRQKKEEKSKEE